MPSPHEGDDLLGDVEDDTLDFLSKLCLESTGAAPDPDDSGVSDNPASVTPVPSTTPPDPLVMPLVSPGDCWVPLARAYLDEEQLAARVPCR